MDNDTTNPLPGPAEPPDREGELARAQRIGRVGGFEIDLRGGRFRNRRSPEYLAVHGLPAEAADEPHEAWVSRLHPEDRARTDAYFRATVLGDATDYAAEYRIVVPGQGMRWIAAKAEIERDANGAPLRMVGVHIDITGSKEAEQTLREVLEAIGEAYYALDDRQRVVTVSRRALELWGRTEAELVGRRLIDIFPGAEAGNTYQAALEAMRTRRHIRVEGSAITLGGRWVEQDAYPTAAGGVAIAFRDIHDRKSTELALRRSEARFRAAVAAVSGIVWTADAAGRVVAEQPGWAGLTGQAPAEYRGLGWTMAVHPDDRQATLDAWAGAISTGTTLTLEHRLRCADGAYRLFAVRAVPVAGEDGGVGEWVGVHTDVTADRQARDELARLNETLEARVRTEVQAREAAQHNLHQAQRVQALGQLAGGIAHDINNVLQAVQGGAARIARHPHDAAGVARLAAMLQDATRRGASVTRRLLAFSRPGELRAEPLSVAPLLEGLRELLQHTLGSGIAVELAVEDGLPPLLADKGQLETVLVNLATNARDAMPAGGTLNLSAALLPMPASPLAEPWSAAPRTGPHVQIAVRDTGVGMDPATLARAAEPFFSTKEAGRGTGLGLAIARGFAQQSGGGLDIESSPGAGTTVRLWLPVSLRGAAEAQDEAWPQDPVAHAHVLLVDDDGLVRDSLAAELRAAGLSVRSASDGAAALDALAAGAPADLLVTDLSMPGMDGVALIAAARQLRPGLPAILLTGFATEAAGLAVGGRFSLLRKPVTSAELCERIAVVLEGARAGGC